MHDPPDRRYAPLLPGGESLGAALRHSYGGDAAVDGDDLTGDERRRIGGEQRRQTLEVLRSAEPLERRVLSRNPWLVRGAVPAGTSLDGTLASYTDEQTLMLTAWFELVAYLYDGRLGALMEAGRGWKGLKPGFLKLAAENYISRHVGLLASGASTTSRYSRGILRFMGRHALRGVDPKTYAIR